MKYKYFVLALCLSISIYLVSKPVNARAADWKLMNKSTIASEYVSNIKVDQSGYGSTVNVSYSKMIKYTKPITRYKSEAPFYVENARGWLSCFDKNYTTEIFEVRDQQGNVVKAKNLPFKKKYTTISQHSFEDKLFQQYCKPDRIAAAKEQKKAEIKAQNKDIIQAEKVKKAEQAKLKQQFQPLVKEYGDITSVEACNPNSMVYSDCDYQVHTSFKVYGAPSQGSIVGMAPYFFKGNDIYVKNGVIVKVVGVGKEREYLDSYYKKGKKQ